LPESDPYTAVFPYKYSAKLLRRHTNSGCIAARSQPDHSPTCAPYRSIDKYRNGFRKRIGQSQRLSTFPESGPIAAADIGRQPPFEICDGAAFA
jgi:hypothetical protein